MKATELMIGDWVNSQLDGHPIQIDEEVFYILIKGYDDGIEPIPLTHEILEKNGWKETQYWLEYQDGKNTIQCCLPDMRGIINGIEIENFKCEYAHQYQHLLRLCGLNELADNFKV